MRDKEAFENHPLWKTISEIQGREDLRELETGTRNYLKALLEHLLRRKEHTNPYLVPETSLDKIQDQLIYAARNIPGTPNSVASYVDDAFYEVSSNWPAMAGSKVVDITVASFDAIMDDMSKQIEKAHQAVDIVEETKEAYTTEIEKLESDIASYRKEASETIESVALEAKSSAEELNTELGRNIENANTKANESSAATQAEFISSLTDIENQAQDLLDKVSNKASKISGRVIADTYGEYARNKAIFKFIYDVLAILFAVAGIFLVGYALVGMHADETSATVFKTAVSVASFTVSGFLFKRGTYEQREAKTAKRTELTLRQYEAFIANLDEADKDAITKDIADRVFIKGEIDNDIPTFNEAIAQRGLSEKELKAILEIFRTIEKSAE